MFEWIVGIVEQLGYAGVALLMFLENVFPPIPSELIMPLAGFSAARGEMNVVGVIVAGSIGSLAGAWVWYAAGRWFGHHRVEWLIRRWGRWLTVSLEDYEKAREWFRWHAGLAVFLGRLIPAIRTLISIPAGIAEMPLLPFLLWSTLGTVLWTTFLTIAGVVLESQYERVAEWVDPISKIVVAAVVLIYLYRLVTYRDPAKQ